MTTELRTIDNKTQDFLYEELTYKIIGILIETHKELGPYAREKQVCDLLAKKFSDRKLKADREVQIGDSGNIADFIIEDVIVLELKTVPFLASEHFDQVKRYLYQSNLKLGLLVNFRDKRLHPKRVLSINNLRNTAELL